MRLSFKLLLISLTTHRPPLGISIPLDDDDAETCLRLGPGDRILLASDGLSEAMDANGAYLGNAPIEAAVGDDALDCGAVVERLRAALDRHCGGRSTTDDVTILCVDRV